MSFVRALVRYERGGSVLRAAVAPKGDDAIGAAQAVPIAMAGYCIECLMALI